MNFRKLSTVPFLAAALVLPTLSHADSMWHPEDGERNVSYHSGHFKSTKTRAEVVAEVEAASKDGTLAALQRNLPLPVKNVASSKTRQQVIDEMRNESPAERRARVEMNRGN